MSEPARSVPSEARPSGVVRPISRAATRRCSRPGCPSLATATLSFRYDEQHARLEALVPDSGPETYDLCGEHADRTRPPFGWSLKDDRPEEVPVDTPDVADLSSARTVAVLAAALRGQAGGPQPEVDTAALDAIVDQPFDDPGDDLYGTVDEADPVTDTESRAPSDALSELSALSERSHDQPGPVPDADHDDHDDPDVIEQVPARTVPAAHRPD